MIKFEIIADGSADMPYELAAERGIKIVPFYVMTEGGEYKKQGVDISTAEFYQWMTDNPKSFPKSAAPSPEDFFSAFEKEVLAEKEVVCVCITDKFSGSIQNANIAQQMITEKYPKAKVTVLNSKVNTVLEGQLVLELCNLRDAGFTLADALVQFEKMRDSARIFFTIGSLDYLKNGGRIGKLIGTVGALMGIRPIITLKEGEIHPSGITLGRMRSLSKVLETAEKYIASMSEAHENISVVVGYGYDVKEAEVFALKVKELLSNYGYNDDVPIRVIGAVVGVHTGPLPLGIGVTLRAKI